MRAIVCNGKGGLDTLSEATLPEPELKPTDVLVELRAAAVNPVDGKNREYAFFGEHKNAVFGYDGCGVVKKLGTSVTAFQVGDEVIFAGDITRNGSFAELIAVDSRICGKKPKSLDAAASAALPLVCLTGWELLFENFRLPMDGSGKDLVFMMVNGAGGVGSAAIQLARKVLGCSTVVATASRPETKEWCLSLGATHVINHHKDLEEELKAVGLDKVDVCFCGVDVDKVFDKVVAVMRPGGRIGCITVEDSSKVDVAKLFMPARLTLSFEFMFMRPMMDLHPESQGIILSKVADLVDSGNFKDIAKTRLQGLTLDTVKEGMTLQDSGKCMGKIAIDFSSKSEAVPMEGVTA